MHASLADDWVGVSLFMQTLELELRLTRGFPDRGTPTLWAQGQTKYDGDLQCQAPWLRYQSSRSDRFSS